MRRSKLTMLKLRLTRVNQSLSVSFGFCIVDTLTRDLLKRSVALFNKIYYPGQKN